MRHTYAHGTWSWRSDEEQDDVDGLLDGFVAADLGCPPSAARAITRVVDEAQRLRSVLGHCPRGIAVLDVEGRLVGYNRELVRLLGEPPRMGESFEALFSTDDRAILEEVVRCAGTERRSAGIVRAGGANGREIEFFAATLPGDGDTSSGVVLAGEDRTNALETDADRARVDEANQGGAFRVASSVARHELLAMLAVVESALADVAEEHPDTRSQQRVATAVDAIRHAIDMTSRRSMLPAAHTLVDSATEVEPVIRRAARLALVGAARRRVIFHTNIEPGARVAVAERLVVQIVTNLLRNAVQAVEARPGLGTVHLEAALSEGHIRLGVRDDGVGIAPSQLQHVFDPGETTRPGASGLGLAIVKELVDACGGTIRVVSEVGEGTTFVVALPAAPAADAVPS